MSDVPPTNFQVDPHPQQKEAALDVLSHFRGAVHRYVILLAPCQSGKTGTFHYVARKALESGLVDNVYLICGSAETVLRDQANEDALVYNATYVNNGKFQVIFHSQFKKSSINPKRALIIVDESHMDQGANQQLKKFAFRNGFDFWGTTDDMRQNETFILSVSATPYSELSDIYHKVTPNKTVVELKPGDGYVGIDAYLYQGRIHSTFDVTKKWAKFARRIRAKGNRYNLIRTYGEEDNGTYQKIVSQAEAEGFKVLHYTQDKVEIAITRKEQTEMIRATLTPSQKNNSVRIKALRSTVPCLEDEPAYPTLIMLKGKLRAGKVVPKKFIGLVWEDSKNPNTDTVIQSLLGRMCGYEFGDELPDIYISGELLIEAKTIIKMNSISRHIMMPHIMPMRGTNIRPGHGSAPKESETGRDPCVPILWRPDCAEYFEGPVTRHSEEENDRKRFLFDEFKTNNFQLVREHTGLTAEQKQELLEVLPTLTSKKVHIRNFYGTAPYTVRFYENVRSAYDTQTSPTIRIDSDPYVTFCVVYDDFRCVDANAGDVYIYFNTKAHGVGFMTRQSLKTRIPFTTGKEMFRCRLTEAVASQSTAGLCIGIRNTVMNNPTSFRVQLRSILEFDAQQKMLGDDGLLVNPIIKPMGALWIQLSKVDYAFTSFQNNALQRILADLQTEFHVTFALKTLESQDKILVKQIAWSY